jgi:HNH endonuclease
MWKMSSYPPYEVSDSGFVRNSLTGRILKSFKTGKYRNYHAVDICGKTKKVHLLVLETFIGPAPIGMLGCHRDDNTDNNVLTNLLYGSPQYNSLTSDYTLAAKNATKTHCSRGHEFTDHNTHIAKSGARICRACDLIRTWKKRGKI